ncbi:MAG: hypothetical protein ACP5JJ_07615 [Anaerolineae bacterium]
MKALQFDVTVLCWVAGMILGAVYKPLFWSGLSCLRRAQLPEGPRARVLRAVFDFD